MGLLNRERMGWQQDTNLTPHNPPTPHMGGLKSRISTTSRIISPPFGGFRGLFRKREAIGFRKSPLPTGRQAFWGSRG